MERYSTLQNKRYFIMETVVTTAVPCQFGFVTNTAAWVRFFSVLLK